MSKPKQYRYKSPENRMRSRRLLRELLPYAQERANREGSSEESSGFIANSGLGENLGPWMTLDHVCGIHVYRGVKGGWFADIEFKDLPAGIPNVVGTPVAMPLSNRSEAIDQAISMLSIMIERAAAPNAAPSPDDAEAVFEYDEVELHIPARLIATLKEVRPPDVGSAWSRERLDEIRDELPGSGEMTKERLDDMGEEDRMKLVTVCAIALSFGIIRWPEREEQAYEGVGKVN